MSDLTTLLFGMPATRPGKSDDDARIKLLFGKPSPMLDRNDLGAIAERVFQRGADYFDETPTKKNRKSLAARVEGFIADIDQLHPATFRPMIEHRHLAQEFERLLLLVRAVRAASISGVVGEPLKAELHRLALLSKMLSGKVNAHQRDQQPNWIDLVIDRANELKRKNPKLKTSGIALEIAQDAIANPNGKGSDSIRKLLNKGKIR